MNEDNKVLVLEQNNKLLAEEVKKLKEDKKILIHRVEDLQKELMDFKNNQNKEQIKLEV